MELLMTIGNIRTYIPSVGNGHIIDRVWDPAGADDSIRPA